MCEFRVCQSLLSYLSLYLSALLPASLYVILHQCKHELLWASDLASSLSVYYSSDFSVHLLTDWCGDSLMHLLMFGFMHLLMCCFMWQRMFLSWYRYVSIRMSDWWLHERELEKLRGYVMYELDWNSLIRFVDYTTRTLNGEKLRFGEMWNGTAIIDLTNTSWNCEYFDWSVIPATGLN